MSEDKQDRELALSLKNIGVTYKKSSIFGKSEYFVALSDVSFDLYQGESLGVIGRNGAGKSTLLKLLGGIMKPDSGEVVDMGLTKALLSRQVGFDPLLSGRDNAILSALLLGFSDAEIKEKMDLIVKFAELEEFIDQPLRTYSLGMRARLGFAVSYELAPDILLIDETLGVGDIKFQVKSRKVIAERLSSDKTVVLVSHNGDVIKNLCDRAVWIEDGKSVLQGEASMVVDKYESSQRKA